MPEGPHMFQLFFVFLCFLSSFLECESVLFRGSHCIQYLILQKGKNKTILYQIKSSILELNVMTRPNYKKSSIFKNVRHPWIHMVWNCPQSYWHLTEATFIQYLINSFLVSFRAFLSDQNAEGKNMGSEHLPKCFWIQGGLIGLWNKSNSVRLELHQSYQYKGNPPREFCFNSSVSSSQLRKIKLQFFLSHAFTFFLQICIKSIYFILLFVRALVLTLIHMHTPLWNF